MSVKKPNSKKHGRRWGVTYVVWHVALNKPHLAVRLDTGETMPVAELEKRAKGTRTEVTLTGDNAP